MPESTTPDMRARANRPVDAARVRVGVQTSVAGGAMVMAVADRSNPPGPPRRSRLRLAEE